MVIDHVVKITEDGRKGLMNTTEATRPRTHQQQAERRETMTGGQTEASRTTLAVLITRTEGMTLRGHWTRRLPRTHDLTMTEMHCQISHPTNRTMTIALQTTAMVCYTADPINQCYLTGLVHFFMLTARPLFGSL